MKKARLVTIRDDMRISALTENSVIDLHAGYNYYLRKVEFVSKKNAQRRADEVVPPDMTKFLEVGEKGIQAVYRTVDFTSRKGADEEVIKPLEGVRLGPPIPRPKDIIGLSRNYPAFAREAGIEAPPKFPLIFMKARSTIIGPEEYIILPDLSKGPVMHEIELAVVIGRGGQRIPEDNAFDHVVGYTIIDDITAHDIIPLYGRRGLIIAKSFYTFAPLGPCLVLKEQIEDPHNLKVEHRINGELFMEGNTGDMTFKIPSLISFISSVMTLEPGDIIATGTPMNTGPVKPGDLCEAKIEGIGVLRNRVAGTKT